MLYEAFFVTNEIKGTLKQDIRDKHITTEYQPAITHESLYGAKCRFRVSGYGIDEENEGLLVYLVSVDVHDMKDRENKANELTDLYKSIGKPHITLSISQDGKPVNTKTLNFSENIPKQYKDLVIDTVFGGCEETYNLRLS